MKEPCRGCEVPGYGFGHTCIPNTPMFLRPKGAWVCPGCGRAWSRTRPGSGVPMGKLCGDCDTKRRSANTRTALWIFVLSFILFLWARLR